MHLTGLVAALAFAAPFASAKCFGGGVKGDMEFARSQLEEVCRAITRASIRPDQTESRCRKDKNPDSPKWEFEVTRIAPEEGRLDWEICKRGLLLEIDECDGGQGGASDYRDETDEFKIPLNGWRFVYVVSYHGRLRFVLHLLTKLLGPIPTKGTAPSRPMPLRLDK